MLQFKFGTQVDMTTVSFIDFSQVGDISDILSVSSTQLIAITTTGATVTLTGIFDLSSETTILNSILTGIIVKDFDDSLIFSFTGIENITIGNLVLTPDTAILTILDQVSAGVTIIGSDFSDVLVGATGNDFINGNAGDDTLKSSNGADQLFGETGDDILKGGSGKDTLDGGEGSDTYLISANENKADLFQDSGLGVSDVDILDVSKVGFLPFRGNFNHDKNGIEQITGAPDGTTISGDLNAVNWDFSEIELTNIELQGSLSADTIIGSTGADFIKGRSGKDSLSGGNGDDTLKGGKGADQLFGDAGDDTLKGGRGLDTLEGGSGNDILTGGIGSDDFIINNTQEAGDLITDFDRVEGDRLLLNGGVGVSEFQWGYQDSGATKADIIGAITSNFLLEANNQSALGAKALSAAGSLFGPTIGGGLTSVAYFYGLTTVNDHLYYMVVSQMNTGTTMTNINFLNVATLSGITGTGTGDNQLAASDIILF